MKIVINNCFGGFGINRNIASEHGLDQCDESRTDPKLIELIESGVDCNTSYSKLVVVEIPDDATDYYIEEYDGAESILYVIDGKIRHI